MQHITHSHCTCKQTCLHAKATANAFTCTKAILGTRLHPCPNTFAHLVKRVCTFGRTHSHACGMRVHYKLHLGGPVTEQTSGFHWSHLFSLYLEEYRKAWWMRKERRRWGMVDHEQCHHYFRDIKVYNWTWSERKHYFDKMTHNYTQCRLHYSSYFHAHLVVEVFWSVVHKLVTALQLVNTLTIHVISSVLPFTFSSNCSTQRSIVSSAGKVGKTRGPSIVNKTLYD